MILRFGLDAINICCHQGFAFAYPNRKRLSLRHLLSIAREDSKNTFINLNAKLRIDEFSDCKLDINGLEAKFYFVLS